MEHVIELDRVSYAYNGSTALEEVDLAVRRGDFLAVIGPNGGGKTTLLRLILGVLSPTAGKVRVLGHEPAEAAPRLGYLPQSSGAARGFPVSVLDVVLMGRLGPGARGFRHPREDRDKALEALRLVGMEPFAARRIDSLSGGERQRVLIARALVSDPEILLLDEPASGVDPEGRERLYAILHDLNRTMTILMVSHEIGIVAASARAVACVNRTLHYHDAPEITREMFEMMYGGCQGQCPVELFAHGVPHRVVAPHVQPLPRRRAGDA